MTVGLWRRPAPAEPVVPATPELAPDVTLHPPIGDQGDWFVQRGTRQYFKVQPDLVRLLRSLDGERTVEDLVAALGRPWTAEQVDACLRTAHGAGLLADPARRRRRQGRLRFVPPFTVQLTLVRPGPGFARLARALAGLVGRPAAAVCAVLGVAGLLALAVGARTTAAALGEPQPYVAVVALVLGVLVSTGVHELAHGVVLAARGGRPARLGVMLFYLLPAFFCDVSDGWRLPSGRDRVHVALAGIAVQVGIGGLAACVALVTPDAVAEPLALFAVATYLASLANAVPFIKLDGYIALMNHVGVSHLRDKAMADARAATAHVLVGAGEVPRRLPHRWAVPYGLACTVFPLVVVVNALTIWADLLRRLGWLGGALMTTLLALVGHRAVTGAARFAREARRAGAPTWRVGVAGVLAVTAVGWVLTAVQVPARLVGGYEVDARTGTAVLQLPTSAPTTALAPGATVELRRAGVALSSRVGTAHLGDAEPVTGTAPFSSLFPVSDREPRIPVLTAPLEDVTGEPGSQGMAVVDLGTESLGEWVLRSSLGALTRDGDA